MSGTEEARRLSDQLDGIDLGTYRQDPNGTVWLWWPPRTSYAVTSSATVLRSQADLIEQQQADIAALRELLHRFAFNPEFESVWFTAVERSALIAQTLTDARKALEATDHD